jgi:hypothetical protein
LALKANHRALRADVGQLLDDPRYGTADMPATADSGHGGIETRTSLVSAEIEGLQKPHRWLGLFAMGRVIRTRYTATTATSETAYYLLSAALSSKRLGQVARSHSGVENRLHWTLNAFIGVRISLNFDTFRYHNPIRCLTAPRSRRIWRSGGFESRSRIILRLHALFRQPQCLGPRDAIAF